MGWTKPPLDWSAYGYRMARLAPRGWEAAGFRHRAMSYPPYTPAWRKEISQEGAPVGYVRCTIYLQTTKQATLRRRSGRAEPMGHYFDARSGS